MPTYLQPVETDQLTLPSSSEFHVVMKRKATYGDQLAAQSAMIQMDQSAVPGATPQAKMDWGAYNRAITARLIVSWDLSDENGGPIPITPANLDRLTPEDGAFLSAEAQKRLGLRTPEQERDFAAPSSGS